MAVTYESVRGRLLIDGRWRESTTWHESRNPSDLTDIVGESCWATSADAQSAIDAARRALPAWSRFNIQLRAELLRRVGDIIHERADRLATLLAREEGKVFKDAKGEAIRAAQLFHYYAGECVRHPGSYFRSLRDGFNVIVDYEPVGVVALITPWNFPLGTPASKIAPALAFGNTVVFKPSEVTPGCAVALTEILIEGGIPPGVFNLVLGSGADLGQALIAGADGVSFTGATPTGRTVLQAAAKTMTKVQLELGGKNPLVVLDDADLDQAVTVALDGAFRQTGQRCTASSRLIVTRGIHDAFVERLREKVSEIRVGNALDEATEMGPVATDAQLTKNVRYLAAAKAEGAELVCGGTRLERPTRGYYLAPALFTRTTNQMAINREEVFGPIASVIRVSDLDEAIGVVCDSDFALSSAICTKNIRSAEKFRRESRAGMVMVNAPTAGVEYHVPFGGRPASGYGAREQGTSAAEFFTETKTTYLNHGVI